MSEIRSLKAQRHMDMLPVNGQRTRSNAGTWIRKLKNQRPLEEGTVL